jgi:PTS system galactitol-specific IIA component
MLTYVSVRFRIEVYMPESLTSLHIAENLVVIDPPAENAEQLLTLLAERAHQAGYVHAGFKDALLERERGYPTGLPSKTPAAIPHADPQWVITPGIGVALLHHPIEFHQLGAPTQTVAVHLVLLLLVTDPKEQATVLSRVVAMLQREELQAELTAITEPALLVEAIERALG